MLLVYVDDAIICGPSSKVIDEIIASLKEDYDVTDEGEIDDYLGVNVSRPTEDTIELRQPHLIPPRMKASSCVLIPTSLLKFTLTVTLLAIGLRKMP